MRIQLASGEKVASVYLFLARAEAAELRDSLDALLDAGGAERHEHVSAADYQAEITIALDSA